MTDAPVDALPRDASPSSAIPAEFPRDWYWLADDGRLYASREQHLVARDAPAYLAWRAAGHVATRWPVDEANAQTAAALQAVLDPYSLCADLAGYAATRRYAFETAGITVGGHPIRTDRESQGMIGNAFVLASAMPSLTLKFKGADGSFVVMDATGIQAVAMAVAQHVQAAFAKEADVVAAIAAGQVATRADVDAAFAA